MKKVLITTTVSGFVPQFEMNNVRILQEMGYEVHYAANYNTVSYGKDNHRLDGTGIVRHQIDYTRSPFLIKENIVAYHQLEELLKQEQFELVHCHTPVAAVLARLVARKYRKKGLKVVYTAHGFHFFKGASLEYWLMFYTVERFLAGYTDTLITINEDDYKRAKRFCRFKKTKVEYIPGVGLNTAYWSGQALLSEERVKLREEVRSQLGLAEGQLALVSVGELIPRKNHGEVIQTLAGLIKQTDVSERRSFHYYICGHGDLQEKLKELIAAERVGEYVTLLDYQENMRRILFGMDVFIFPSVQEGMPMALLEAVTVGLPVIARKIRGNSEIVEFINRGRGQEEKRAYAYCNQKELEQLLWQLLVEQKELFSEGSNSDMSLFDSKKIIAKMREIYGGLRAEKEN